MKVTEGDLGLSCHVRVKLCCVRVTSLLCSRDVSAVFVSRLCCVRVTSLLCSRDVSAEFA